MSADAAVRQSMDNLHDDIMESILDSQKGGIYGNVVSVTDPGPSMFGPPTEGLVDIEYQCPRTNKYDPKYVCGTKEHTHHALFGPTDEDWTPEKGPVEHYSLYAD
jgi:hypothetical protein